MDSALEVLGSSVGRPGQRSSISPAELKDVAARCSVVLPVGGEGSRLRGLTDAQNIQKNALVLPSGESLIERTIRLYRDAGFHDFVALVFNRAQSISDLLNDGSKLGVRVRYSRDPEIPVGRGGAIRHAIENGSIPEGHRLICHNPDDVIAKYPGDFVSDIVADHLAGVRGGAVATAVLVDGANLPYTGLALADGRVTEVVAYPFVPIPAHVGITLFEPEIQRDFRELFPLDRKVDFEPMLFPKLAREGRLYSSVIPRASWFQVNDPKSWDQLVAAVGTEAGP